MSLKGCTKRIKGAEMENRRSAIHFAHTFVPFFMLIINILNFVKEPNVRFLFGLLLLSKTF